MVIKPEKLHQRGNLIIAYILSVLCIATVISLGIISDSKSLIQTYNSGEVCDVGSVAIDIELLNEEGKDYTWIDTEEEAYNWKYLYLDISDANFNEGSFELIFYKNYKPTGNKLNCQIDNGFNIIELDGSDFDCIQFKSMNDSDVSFKTNCVQLREKKAVFTAEDYLRCFIPVSLIVAVILIIIIAVYNRIKWRIDWYAPVDLLQRLYIAVGNKLVWISVKVSKGTKRNLRIAAFICWMFWIMFTYNIGKYLLSTYFKINVVLFCITMILIAISMLEKELHKIDWNKPLVHAWLWLSIIMCISELFVSKRFCMLGYVNLIVFGFYYFVWGNLDNKSSVIEEIMAAFKIAFAVSVCFTLLFRPRDELGGLIGHTWNPNIYGIFCAIVLMAFLASLREGIIENNLKKSIFNIAGVIVALSFVLLAGSRAGMILAAPGILFFAVEYIAFIRTKKIKWLKGLAGVLVFVIAFFGCHVFLSWATVNFPVKQIVFSWDSYIPNEIEIDVISVGMETPVIEKIAYNNHVRTFLTGRNLYWMQYFRDINVLGHEYYPEMWGGARTPHNGILGIMYRYGIFAIIPYMLTFLNSCVVSFRQYLDERNKKTKAFYIWICVIGITLCMLVENFERPLLATEWLWWYWCLGLLFTSDNKSDKVDIDIDIVK